MTEQNSKTVSINAEVALQEQMALTEHYRNRNLLLAQAIADLKSRMSGIDAELEALRAARAPAAENAQ